jgi:hypothetical protein
VTRFRQNGLIYNSAPLERVENLESDRSGAKGSIDNVHVFRSTGMVHDVELYGTRADHASATVSVKNMARARTM